jgi:hypothetical protein
MIRYGKSSKTMSVNLKIFDPGDYSHAPFYIPDSVTLSWNYIAPSEFYPDSIDKLITRIRANIHNDTDIVILWGAPNRLTMYDECITAINRLADSITNPVILFNGNYSKKDVAGLTCAYSEYAYFEHIARNTWPQTDITQPRHQQFMMIGTKDYPTRKYILSEIVAQGLDRCAYISYKQVNNNGIYPGNYSQTEIDYIINQANRVNTRLPWPALDNSIEFPQLPRQFLLDSYVNMVTDTYFEGEIFVSEKVYTAIAHGQIFVMLAPAGTLEYLRRRGYQTFGNYIDESYDTIENNFQRLEAVTKLLVGLAQSDLEKLYAQCQTIIQHNYNLFYTRDTGAEFVAEIQQISG